MNLSVLLLLAALGVAPAPAPIRVCVVSNPTFLNLQGSKPVGLEYDLLASFAASEKRALDLRQVPQFKELFERLAHGDCDILAGMITRTPERETRLDLSEPYFPVLMVVVQRRGGDITALSDLAGRKVATIEGTTHEAAMREVKGATLVSGRTYEVLVEMLLSGAADAMVCDSAVLVPLLERFPALTPAFSVAGREAFAFALAKGSPLTAALDAHLRGLKQTGEYAQMLRTYFDAETVRQIVGPE